MSADNDVRPKPRIITTRFTNATWKQNEDFRESQGWKGCVYGAKCPFGLGLDAADTALVLEMNNDTNEIEGVGKISCRPLDSPFRIYNPRGNNGDDAGHNRVVYSGQKRISRSDLPPWAIACLQILEPYIFRQNYRVITPFKGRESPMAVHPTKDKSERRYFEISEWRAQDNGTYSARFDGQEGLWDTHWVHDLADTDLADTFRGRHIKNRMGFCNLPRVFYALPAFRLLEEKIVSLFDVSSPNNLAAPRDGP